MEIPKEELMKYPNVIGVSNKLQNKIVKGKTIHTLAIRVYVIKKVPLKYLRKEDVIPKTIKGIPTDVVEIGRVTAPPNKEDFLLSTSKTKRIRPVKLGISIGHWDITAGSLGMIYKRKGELLIGSNAHVLTPEPSLYPKNVREKRILQPGSYHGGRKIENVVGLYEWHKRIRPLYNKDCIISKALVKTLNFVSRMFGKKTRFETLTLEPNYLDFAVYYPIVDHEKKTFDESVSNEPFIGHLFAGSKRIGVICKVDYIMKEGFCPVFEPATVKEEDVVLGSSFWCSYKTMVTDSSASVIVDYDSYKAMFDDVIFVKNDGVIRGGWSGTGFRKIS